MLQVKNDSPFEPAIAVFPNEQGVDTVYAVLKATFTLGARLSIAEERVPPVMADEYWDEPDSSSLRYGSDLHLSKPSTDVVLVGQAWAPGGRAVTELDTAVVVAERRKVIRVHGDRRFKKGLIRLSMTAPEPFQSMPLVYERAFGGTQVIDEDKGEILGEPRNPVGVGFKGRQKASDAEGAPVPNLEDPTKPYKGLSDKGEPACFGFVAPSWMPRVRFAGTYDEAWQKKRAPFLPQDFDSRFFNAAHPDLTFDRYLEGGEPVELINLSRRGRLEFRLPRCELRIDVKIGGGTETLPVHCETVLFEPDEERMSMVWRAAYVCGKRALEVEEISISAGSLSGVGAV